MVQNAIRCCCHRPFVVAAAAAAVLVVVVAVVGQKRASRVQLENCYYILPLHFFSFYALLIFIKIPISKPIYQNRCKNRNVNNYEMKFLRKICISFSLFSPLSLSFFWVDMVSFVWFVQTLILQSLFTLALLYVYIFTLSVLENDSFHPITHIIRVFRNGKR